MRRIEMLHNKHSTLLNICNLVKISFQQVNSALQQSPSAENQRNCLTSVLPGLTLHL